jgi:hypothetical protein
MADISTPAPAVAIPVAPSGSSITASGADVGGIDGFSKRGGSGMNAGLIAGMGGHAEIMDPSSFSNRRVGTANDHIDDKKDGITGVGPDGQKQKPGDTRDTYKEMSQKLAAQKAEIARVQAYESFLNQKEEASRLLAAGAITAEQHNLIHKACNEGVNSCAKTKTEEIYVDHGYV